MSIFGPSILISPPTSGSFPPILISTPFGSKSTLTSKSTFGLFNSSEAPPFARPDLRSSIFGNLISLSGSWGIFPIGNFLQ